MKGATRILRLRDECDDFRGRHQRVKVSDKRLEGSDQARPQFWA